MRPMYNLIPAIIEELSKYLSDFEIFTIIIFIVIVFMIWIPYHG